MNEVFYHILVIGVAAYAVIKGFHERFTGQVSGVLGLAFGIVCAHVFSDDVADIIRDMFPAIKRVLGSGYICSVLGAVIIYVSVYMLFKCLTKILRNAMAVFEAGMLDSLFGSFFSLLKYMVGVSIFLNLLICVNPRSSLLRHVSSDDGNIVGEVMLLAPALLGCVGCDDLYHLLQLHDAKKISDNITPVPDVINKGMTDYVVII